MKERNSEPPRERTVCALPDADRAFCSVSKIVRFRVFLAREESDFLSIFDYDFTEFVPNT